jgi:hypothetical protein
VQWSSKQHERTLEREKERESGGVLLAIEARPKVSSWTEH